MKSAFAKDLLRTIGKERKRLLSLLVITAVGVSMMCGLQVACDDLRGSADRFFDKQSMHDISVVCTLGLTEEDVSVLSSLECISRAEGVYSEAVTARTAGGTIGVDYYTFTPGGLDEPYVVEGRLPTAANEVAVTQSFLLASGLQLGDPLTLTETLEESDTEENNTDFEALDDLREEDSPNLLLSDFVITAVVTDVNAMVCPDGPIAVFRNSGTDNGKLFLLWDAVDSEVYTSVLLQVEGAAALGCFGTDYRSSVRAAMDTIEAQIKQTREEARYAAVLAEAETKLDDAEALLEEAFADADAEIADARQELDDGWEELTDGEAQLRSSSAKTNLRISQAQAQIDAGWAELNDGLAQLDAYEAQATEGLSQVNAALPQLEAAVAQLEAALGQEGLGEEEQAALQAQLEPLRGQLSALQGQKAALEASLSEISSRRAAAESAAASLQSAQAELNQQAARAQHAINVAARELEDGRQELEDGEAEFAENVAEYAEQSAEARRLLSDARAKLADIAEATWYVQDRDSISSFADMRADMDCIDSISSVFAVMFFVIAVLVCLTTMTRMVEEDRGLIGTYQALGFRTGEILCKYVVFSSCACLLGWLVGNLAGFVALPEFLFVIFRNMYQIPVFHLFYYPLLSLRAVLLFLVGILGATIFTCNHILRHMPAFLMRPKPPQNGSRILLERIGPVWRRMSFLNKVTARNLFRYKKRLLMTVVGIAGCTGLLICGFSIKDTVDDLLPRQFGNVTRYDLLAVTAGDEDNEQLMEYLSGCEGVSQSLNLQLSSVELQYEDGSLPVQLYVYPDDADLSPYLGITLRSGQFRQDSSDRLIITENAATVLGFSVGDSVTIRDLQLNHITIPVTGIAANYLGNSIFLSQSLYEGLFGEYSPNAALIRLTEGADPYAEADRLSEEDEVLSYVSIQRQIDGFSSAFILMDMVFYVVTVLAAAMAFAVLYTLATTNISERERELATIKVLGFYDAEVYRYVNKETRLLTILGILLGMPLGRVLSGWLGVVLKLPSINYAVSLHTESYLYAAAIALVFSFAVELLTNRILYRIDPVEALKSIE